MNAEAKLIVNLTRGSVVCERVELADRPLRRMRGLLGRKSLVAGEGMLLQPAPSIHTAFMSFPIDVVFLDRNFRVTKLVPELAAWRTASSLDARSTLEIAAGELKRRRVEVGDQLIAVDPNSSDDEAAVVANVERQISNDDAAQAAAYVPRDKFTPTRVLLVGSDRRFRSVAATLLARRGIDVAVKDHMSDVDEEARRLAVDVVVLDTASLPIAAALQAARLETLHPEVGVVVVSDVREAQAAPMPVLPKWDSFDALMAAIERARPTHTEAGVSDFDR